MEKASQLTEAAIQETPSVVALAGVEVVFDPQVRVAGTVAAETLGSDGWSNDDKIVKP